MPTVVLGLATGANTAQPIRQRKLGLPLTLEEALPLARPRPVNDYFADRDDSSEDFGYLPLTDLVYASVEGSEYTSGLLASVWYEWTCPLSAPLSVEWSFAWSGQSGSGGGAIRVYAPANLGTIPASGSIAVQHNPTGASGTVTATLNSPVAGKTYYVQVGLKEKAGTTGHLSQLLDYVGTDSFTPVIP